MPTFFLAKGRFNLSEIVLRNGQNGKTMIHESPSESSSFPPSAKYTKQFLSELQKACVLRKYLLYMTKMFARKNIGI